MLVTIGMIIWKTFLVIVVIDLCIFAALLVLRVVKLRKEVLPPVRKQDDMWFEQWRKGDFYDL